MLFALSLLLSVWLAVDFSFWSVIPAAAANSGFNLYGRAERWIDAVRQVIADETVEAEGCLIAGCVDVAEVGCPGITWSTDLEDIATTSILSIAPVLTGLHACDVITAGQPAAVHAAVNADATGVTTIQVVAADDVVADGELCRV